jgi:thiol-disulfide isomerase/thioredoxin
LNNRDRSRRSFFAVLGAGAAAALPLARVAAASEPEGASPEQDVWKSIELVGLDGQALSLGQLAAPVVVVHLWASWCATCLGELAPLQDVAERLGPAGVATILVSHPKHWDADQAFLRRARVRLPAYTLAPETSWEARAAAFAIAGGSYAVPRTLVFAGRERRCVLDREGAQDWRSPQTAARFQAWLRSAAA